MSDSTLMITSAELVAWAASVAVKCTLWLPICEAVGTHENAPRAGSNQALAGKPEAATRAGAPEGSLALTVKFNGFPGATDWVAGTLRTGPVGVRVTLSCTATPSRVAEMVTACVCAIVVVFAWNCAVACAGWVKIEDGGVRWVSLLVMASTAVAVALVELRVTWQITGDPATTVFGKHESDTGFSPTSMSEARIDEFCAAALMVTFSS